jgi:enoyl-CoA hydratase/carnithine racemase
MTSSKTPVLVTQESPAFWRVTFDNPPLNLYDPDLFRDLKGVVERLEADHEVTVVVFESAVPDFFMAHLDLLRSDEFDRTPGVTGLAPWPDLATRLAHLPCITVASVRGRARGVGNELAMAMDVRFASRENAVFGQLEIGCGAIPGGGGLERLHFLVGRARAMEIIVSGEDYDADTAELYGFVNRSVPDSELDDFVDRFATRVANFDRAAVAAAKRHLTALGGVPRPNDLTATERTFFGLLESPSGQREVKSLFERGLQQYGDLELNMGERLGPAPVSASTAA